ncbi:MAG TPA: NETI motif-containing protein [Metalysinibacillus jejuensis]|uniref:NETI motif-containing protein n=1 Tax=Metalysinibacillus jejuensis TaxID=914327 RepID=A0A921N9V8_9BACL|nr:NETI motif-containing protein [Metalysinibacillus jejuensis]HJH10162.1 NETI motif-containing protein [Metalysinibacillus jejuensis]
MAIWYEVQQDESIEQCLTRMKQDGYIAVARREEPIFQLVDGEPQLLRQKIEFKALATEE